MAVFVTKLTLMCLACLRRTVFLSVLQRRRSDKTDDRRNRPRAALKNKQTIIYIHMLYTESVTLRFGLKTE